MEIAIVMPAFNEAACIEEAVQAWLQLLSRLDGVLIVVDDGSRDSTAEILNRLQVAETRLTVIRQENQGHGSAILRGYREALGLGARYVFQCDSDNRLIGDDFWRLWDQREKSGLVLGYRRNRQESASRLLISRALSLLNLLAFGVRVKDANVPFRLMRADFLAEFLSILPERVFAPNVFMSVIAARKGYRPVQIPVRSSARMAGKPSIVRLELVKACLRCARELLSFRASNYA